MNAERGEVSAELVVLLPVVVLLIMLCAHVAAWSHASTVATAIAAQVAVTESRYGSTPGDGIRIADEWFTRLQARAASPVTVQGSSRLVRAEVAVAVPPLVPGLPVVARRQVVMVRERTTTQGER